jgi:pyridoxal phosphate enzyme (YggS family)
MGSVPSPANGNAGADREDSLSSGVADRLEQVRCRIREAEVRFGRIPGSVALLAVSKKQEVAKIRSAHAAGQFAFGESYLNEALEKMDALADLSIEWHFIGRIQGNKTRQIAERFSWVHGLTDLRHARRLSQQRPPELPPLKTCIQVNLSGEESKAGIPAGAVNDLLLGCAELPGIQVVGLMTLPPPETDEEAQRAPFRALRELRDKLATPGSPLAELSMGMSADLEAAIAEGSTLVRIGTAVFGPRQPG